MKKLIVFFSVFMSFFLTMSVKAESLGYGIPKSRDHEPPYPGKKLDELINKYNSFYIGDTSKKEIYLTFDTGYEIGNTTKILDTLKKNHVQAAFFVTGHFLKEHPDLVLRMAEEGHIVGNHTWNHPDMTKISDEKIQDELSRVENKFMEITNQEMSKFIRPPEGRLSDNSLAVTSKLGYINVFWSLAFVDWHINQQQGWQYAYNNVIDRIHNGAIILLHTVSTDNTYALDKIITELHKQNYEFKSLENLIIS